MDTTTADNVLVTENTTVNTTFYPPGGGGIPPVDLPLAEFIPVTMAYGLTFVIGVVGNCLVIFSIARNEQMKTITNTFLLSLASADLLLVVFCIPFKYIKLFSYSWEYGEVMCKLIHYVQDVSAICSVTTLTMMSLERYYAIIHPIKAKYVCTVGRARRVTVLLWILSFVLAIPIIYGWQYLEVGRDHKAYWCIRWFEHPVVNRLYEVYMFLLILFVPVCIMSFAYFRICRELWHMTRNRNAMRAAGEIKCTPTHAKSSATSTPSKWSMSEKAPVLKEVKFSEDDATKKQVIKMLVAVIVVFIICWAPALTDNMLKVFLITPMLNTGYFKYMRETFFLMSYANSCVNPIVYGFMSRNFRQAFKRALCSCLKGRQYVRKLTFKKQSCVVQEKSSCSNGQRQLELMSTDMLELTEGTSDEPARV